MMAQTQVDDIIQGVANENAGSSGGLSITTCTTTVPTNTSSQRTFPGHPTTGVNSSSTHGVSPLVHSYPNTGQDGLGSENRANSTLSQTRTSGEQNHMNNNNSK